MSTKSGLLVPALVLLAVNAVASNPLVEKDKYTSTSDCNAANTKWTITSTCTKTVGGGSTQRIKAGVEYAEIGGPIPAPTAVIRDLNDQPIVVFDSGVPVVLELLPSTIDAMEADSLYGTLSTAHSWAGFRTNVDVVHPAAPFESWFKITYTFSAPVQSTGAAWVSSTLDDNPGDTVEDSFGVFPLPAGDSYCFGDGGVSPGCTACPCLNDAPAGTIGGCLNSAGTSARLHSSGTPSVSNDTLRFQVTGANASTFGILISGNDRLPNNPANVCFGLDSGVTSVVLDGLRCVGVSLVRHGSRSTDVFGSIGVENKRLGAAEWSGGRPDRAGRLGEPGRVHHGQHEELPGLLP